MRAALRVRVKPGSPQNRLRGFDPRGVLHVEIEAPPRQGQANQALLRYLGRLLGLPTTALRIKAGERSREKLLLIEGITPEELRARLQEKTG